MKKTVKAAIAAITAAMLLSATAIPIVGWAVDQCGSLYTACSDDDWIIDDVRW